MRGNKLSSVGGGVGGGGEGLGGELNRQNKRTVYSDVKANNIDMLFSAELRNCVKVEVAVLGSRP